jgi:hypothetical protein
VELENALNLVSRIILDKAGRPLREPELILFEGTWLGLTYEQMAESSIYSNNYLMRDVGPKFWKLLSKALGQSVNKTNLRIVLEAMNESEFSPLTKIHSFQDAHLSVTSSLPTLPKNPIKSQKLAVERFSNSLLARNGFDLANTASSYGYTEELEILTQWILEKHCRLVGIWGLNGVGKTTLSRRLVDQIHDQFEMTAVHTLHSAPTDLILPFITNWQARSWLLILNGLESILQPGQTAGHYQAQYTHYGDFFQQISENSHQGCVIVTSLEPPREFIRLEGQSAAVRSLMLSGLSLTESERILEEEQLIRSREWATLINYYQGHPAALRIVSRIIRNLFNGSAVEFLKQQSFMFEDINKLLEQSFDRLSGLEKEILYCLASEGTPTMLATLQNLTRPLAVQAVELLEALDSLKQRSLLNIIHSENSVRFTLQPMIRDYVVHELIAQVCGVSAAQNWQERWALQSTISSLALTPSVSKPTHLSEWLNNYFDADWKPVEMLLAPLTNSPNRLRSIFHLRGEATIKRFKRIQFKATSPTYQSNDCSNCSVVLLIAINPENDQTINICVQVQPNQEETTLPTNLKLYLLDASENILAEIESQEQDNFIQLPYFRGMPQECFKVQLSLNAKSHTEKFVI